MEQIRFTQPISRAVVADWKSAPNSLNNAKLDRATGAVVACRGNRLINQSTEFAIAQKPHVIWNSRLVSGQQGILAADSYNSVLYGCAATGGTGLTAFPANYDGSNADSAGPYITKVVIAEGAKTGSPFPTAHSLVSFVSYVLIPFNVRGEAGPWVYFGKERPLYKFTVDIVVDTEQLLGRTFLSSVGHNLTITCSGCSYIEVYRTSEQYVQDGSMGESALYLLGRAQVNTGTNVAALTDDKRWWPASFQTRAGELDSALTTTQISGDLLVYAGILTFESYERPRRTWLQRQLDNFLDPVEEMLGVGRGPGEKKTYNESGQGGSAASQYLLPGATLDRSLNVHAQLYNTTGDASLTLDADDFEINFAAPLKFSAECMLQQGGIMAYGDVTWPTKPPAVMAMVGGGAGSIKMVCEYRISDIGGINGATTIYGPTVTITDATKVMVAWQGEQALLVLDSSNKLLERLVPDHMGRYLSGFKSVETQKIGVSGDQTRTALTGSVDGKTYWTYNSSINYAVPNGASTTNYTTHIKEQNVVFLSENERPWEVTFEQFFLPDNSPVRKLTPARLSEAESVLDYNGYAFSDTSVFWFKINPGSRQVAFDYVDPTVGIKVTGSNSGAAVTVPQGVVFAGNDNRLYLLSGRRIERLDIMAEGLWATLYDVTYDQSNSVVYVLTDTGVWGYDLVFYKGFFKHVTATVTGSDEPTITYLRGSIRNSGGTPVAYDNVGVWKSDDSFVFLDEASQAVATDASVSTQRISTGVVPLRIDMLVAIHDSGARSAVCSVTGTAITLTAGQRHSFQSSDVGRYILIEDAGTSRADGRNAAKRRITAVGGVAAATLDTAVDANVSDKLCAWPVVNITHQFWNSAAYSKSISAIPGEPYYPKGIGFEHKLTIANFGSLTGVAISTSEA